MAEAKVANDLVDLLVDIEGTVFGTEERIGISAVRERLGLTATDAARDNRLAGRITDAMTSLGWTKPDKTMRCSHINDLPAQKGFRRTITEAEVLRRRQRDSMYFADGQGDLGLKAEEV